MVVQVKVLSLVLIEGVAGVLWVNPIVALVAKGLVKGVCLLELCCRDGGCFLWNRGTLIIGLFASPFEFSAEIEYDFRVWFEQSQIILRTSTTAFPDLF